MMRDTRPGPSSGYLASSVAIACRTSRGSLASTVGTHPSGYSAHRLSDAAPSVRYPFRCSAAASALFGSGCHLEIPAACILLSRSTRLVRCAAGGDHPGRRVELTRANFPRLQIERLGLNERTTELPDLDPRSNGPVSWPEEIIDLIATSFALAAGWLNGERQCSVINCGYMVVSGGGCFFLSASSSASRAWSVVVAQRAG